MKLPMVTDAINRLDYLCNTIPALLTSVDERSFVEKISLDKWSKKEILGHLIDSATNNHQRFVRGQFEDKPVISYDQNKWSQHSFYQQIDTQQLILFWAVYNRQMIEILKRIPRAHLQRECQIGSDFLTLDFLANDYVEHLEHHLRQIVAY